MAKITITIEDMPDNKVRMKAEPDFKTIAKMLISGETLTSAQIMGMRCVNSILEQDKENARKRFPLTLPKYS